ALLSLMLLVITTALVALELRLLGRRRYARVGRGVGRSAAPERLGPWAPAAYLFVVVALGASLGLPLLTLGGWMALVPPDAAALRDVLATFLGTAALAVPAAVLVAVLAVPVAVAALRSRWLGGRLLERLVYLGYAVPPVALALALVMFAIRYAPGAYQTFPLLVFAYLIS